MKLLEARLPPGSTTAPGNCQTGSWLQRLHDVRKKQINTLINVCVKKIIDIDVSGMMYKSSTLAADGCAYVPSPVLSGRSGGMQNTTSVRKAKNTQGNVKM